MSLKTVFKAMNNEGYVIKPLDLYLLSLEEVDSNRAVNVNAPSAVGTCKRSRYYSRTGAERDPGTVDPRTRRIFDNGTKTHERLQGYLEEQGMLLMDEVPVYNKEYNIQGHTDGVLRLSDKEKAILEIKSINSRSFSELKDAKPEHKQQGLIYIYCIEEHRKELHKLYPTKKDFNNSTKKRCMSYSDLYQHLKDGKKYSRSEKITFQCAKHLRMDNLLYNTTVPITKAIFLYENKDTQDLKEFVVSTITAQSKLILDDILKDYESLNACVATFSVPSREGKNRSDQYCRWCAYKTECWN